MENTVNPYETPEGDLVTSTEEFCTIKFYSANCRIGRLRYISRAFALYLWMVPVVILVSLGQPEIGMIVAIPCYIAMFVGLIFAGIQRLHDLNKSGWFILLMFIPLVQIIMIIYMLFFPGDESENNFGAPPPQNQWWHWIGALILPFIAILGIVAAVALPAYQEYTERAKAAQMGQ